MITKENVLHIARLARLKLTEEEIASVTNHLSSILDYVNQLNEVDTQSLEPTSFLSPKHDPLRDDVERPSLPPEAVLQNAPKAKKGYFAIPKVIG